MYCPVCKNQLLIAQDIEDNRGPNRYNDFTIEVLGCCPKCHKWYTWLQRYTLTDECGIKPEQIT